MAKKEKIETNIIPFKREDYIRQLNSVTQVGFRMELIQLRAFVKFLEEIEPLFLELIDGYNKRGEILTNPKADEKEHLSVFDLESIKPYLNSDGEVEVKIMFADLGVSSNHYGRARDLMKAMHDLDIYVPISGKEGQKEMLYTSVFDAKVTAVDGGKRCNYARLCMKKSVLNSMLDIRLGYHDQLKRIAFLSNNIYTTRLYWMVTAKQKKGAKQIEVSLYDFRRFMNLIVKDEKDQEKIRYDRYCDIEKFIIKPASEELKTLAETGNSDFWVEVKRKDRLGEKQNPSAFIIDIHESQVAKLTQKEKCQSDEDREILDLLYKELKQSSRNVNKLMKRVTPDNKKEFKVQAKRVAEHLKTHTEIKKPASYAWTWLDDWLERNSKDAEDVEFTETTQPQPQKPAQPVQQELFPEMTKVEDPRWDKFVEVIKSSVPEPTYETWFSAMKFVSERDGVVKVSIPTSFIGEYIEKNLQKEFQDSIAAAFTNCTEIEYLILKK